MTGMPPRRPQCQTPPYQEEAGKSRSWGEERRHPTSRPSPSVHSSRPGQPGPAQRRVTLQLTTPICWGVKEGRLQRGQGPSPRAFCPRPTQGGSLPRGPPPRGQPRPPAPRASCPGFRSSDRDGRSLGSPTAAGSGLGLQTAALPGYEAVRPTSPCLLLGAEPGGRRASRPPCFPRPQPGPPRSARGSPAGRAVNSSAPH